MALSKSEKQVQVKDLTEKMQKASSIVFTHYLGLTVTDITKLRRELKKNKAVMQVAKKNLIKIAAKEAKLPELPENLMDGAIACIFSMEEPTGGPSTAFKFGKTNDKVKLVGGIFDGKLLTMSEAVSLATIPSKKELLAIFMSMCNSPLTSFASAVGSPLTGFARLLSEIAKKKESEAPAPAPVAAAAEPAAPAPATPPTEVPATPATPPAAPTPPTA